MSNEQARRLFPCEVASGIAHCSSLFLAGCFLLFIASCFLSIDYSYLPFAPGA